MTQESQGHDCMELENNETRVFSLEVFRAEEFLPSAEEAE